MSQALKSCTHHSVVLVLVLVVGQMPAQLPFKTNLVGKFTGWYSGSKLVDLNGDGDLDLIGAGAFGVTPKIQLNLGDGQFVPNHPPRHKWSNRINTPEAMTFGFAVADLDGDGDRDIILATVSAYRRFPNPNKLTLYPNFVWINDGRGNFTEDTTGRLPPHRDESGCVAVGDVDGDGDLDIFIGNSVRFLNPPVLQNRLYLNNGKGYFTDATATNLPADATRAYDADMGDVDGDGDLDILVVDSNLNAHPVVYINDGKGRFLFGSSVTGTVSKWVIFRGDFDDVDGDGDLDVVVLPIAEQVLVYINDGKGNFTSELSRTPMTPVGYQDWVLGDVDDDGDQDIIIYAHASLPTFGPNRLLLNDGKGYFTLYPKRPFAYNSILRLLPQVMGDVDGDGDQDLIAFIHQGHIFFNLKRQILTEYIRLGQPYNLELYAEPNHMMFVALSAGPARMPMGSWGSLRIDSGTMVRLPSQKFTTTIRKTTISLPVPNDSRLLGLKIYAQALDLDLSNPVDMRFTGFMVDKITK